MSAKSKKHLHNAWLRWEGVLANDFEGKDFDDGVYYVLDPIASAIKADPNDLQAKAARMYFVALMGASREAQAMADELEAREPEDKRIRKLIREVRAGKVTGKSNPLMWA